MSMSPARQRLRAFEDATFGADTSRIRGEIERGTGSAFARADEAIRKKFAALDRLIVAEDAAAAALNPSRLRRRPTTQPWPDSMRRKIRRTFPQRWKAETHDRDFRSPSALNCCEARGGPRAAGCPQWRGRTDTVLDVAEDVQGAPKRLFDLRAKISTTKQKQVNLKGPTSSPFGSFQNCSADSAFRANCIVGTGSSLSAGASSKHRRWTDRDRTRPN